MTPGRRTRPSVPQAHNETGQASRHAALDEEVILERASVWVKWIEGGEKVPSRAEARISEAFKLLHNRNNTPSSSPTPPPTSLPKLVPSPSGSLSRARTFQGAWPVAVRRTHDLGGKEATVILALSVGKSAFRELKKKLKEILPTILAGQKWHLSRSINEYVRIFEARLTTEGKLVVPIQETALLTD